MAQPYPTLPIEGFGNGDGNLFPPDSMEEIKEMVTRLCLEINFARNIDRCEKITGGNNHIILFTCLPLSAKYQGQRIACVLRTCLKLFFRSNPPTDMEIKSLVALTHNFRTQARLPIPSTLAYDCTYENAIRSPYMIQERVRGQTLEHEYFMLYADLEYANPRNARLQQRWQYAKCVAAFVAAMERPMLPGYGIFKAEAGMPDKGTSVDIGFSITRDNIDGRKISIEPVFSAWVDDVLNTQVDRVHDVSKKISPEEASKILKLRLIGSQMAVKGLLTTDEPAVLWHADFYPRNIMVQSNRYETVLAGVIDWDDARALPRIITRAAPTFLWEMSKNQLQAREIEIIKEAFDEEIEKLSRGYGNDAYESERKMVRALGIYALFGPDFMHWYEMSFEGLVRGWKARMVGGR
ncbi:hypothetical protein SBOR_5010 [Sclerotinia borealis F-4128]|uniref:Aminoglycoside phosphotransferase domain-containing protein n=1 Tax=Sclerotinia borealis (strain F-4128) TaxID=1432307 RepID=W9CIT7_SCLBF|nr:hypothetical protein SBOR_5010 [Sclerotinia borealis F-4128]